MRPFPRARPLEQFLWSRPAARFRVMETSLCLTKAPNMPLLETGSKRSMSVIAFHEKAGRSQVGSVVFRWTRFFLPPSGRCRHASIRTLEERLVSLGACWAFSFQPVLPSDCRPLVLLL